MIQLIKFLGVNLWHSKNISEFYKHFKEDQTSSEDNTHTVWSSTIVTDGKHDKTGKLLLLYKKSKNNFFIFNAKFYVNIFMPLQETVQVFLQEYKHLNFIHTVNLFIWKIFALKMKRALLYHKNEWPDTITIQQFSAWINW